MKTGPSSSKRITIRDLARELGLSDRSVSQALHPRDSNVRLNPETAERIRLHAQKRNYRVHSGARAIRSGRHFNLGYFEAKKNVVSYPLLGAIEGVLDAAERSGYHVVMIKVPEPSKGKKNPIPFIFQEAHLDALIVAHLGHLSQECKDAIETCGLPVVFLNEKKLLNAVYGDDFSGFQVLTRRLLERGCRRIAYFKGKSHDSRNLNKSFQHYSVKDRLEGFYSALENAGVEAEVLEFETMNQKDAMRIWLKEHSGVEAIICPGDMEALRLFQVLYAEKVAVPEDIWITGYGGDFSSQCAVPLTTMRIPFYEMGTAAAEMAIQLLDQPMHSSLPSRVFPCELIERESTGFNIQDNPG